MILIKAIEKIELDKYYDKVEKYDLYYALFEGKSIRGYVAGNIENQNILITFIEYNNLSNNEIDGLVRGFINNARNMGIKTMTIVSKYDFLIKRFEFYTNDKNCVIQEFFDRGCKTN